MGRCAKAVLQPGRKNRKPPAAWRHDFSTGEGASMDRSRFLAVVPYAVALLTALGGTAARADLRFAHPEVEAGEVRSGAPLSQRFEFVNDGPAPAIVTEVRASCGCLTPRLEPAGTALPHTYRPGEQGTLLLEVNTLSQEPGVHVWPLAVVYETNGRPRQADLRLSGRVVTEVSVRPAELTVFADAAVRHEIVVTDLRPKPLDVTEVRSTSSQVTGAVTGRSRDADGHAVRTVRLEVACDYAEGRRQEMLDLVTDDPSYRILRVPLTVVKRGRRRLSASPDPVTLVAAAGQELPSRVVLVRDADDQPVVVERVEADEPAVTCRWAQGPNHLATVKVHVDRSRLTGRTLQTAIHIHISKPEGETLTVPVTCVLE
jgi:hypothetical protein